MVEFENWQRTFVMTSISYLEQLSDARLQSSVMSNNYSRKYNKLGGMMMYVMSKMELRKHTNCIK